MICMSTNMSVRMYVRICHMRMPIHTSTNMPARISTYVSVHMFIHMSTNKLAHISTHVSMHVHMSIHMYRHCEGLGEG